MSLPSRKRYKNMKRRKAREKALKAEKIADLEAQYKKAVANASNKELVNTYNEMLSIKKEYEKRKDAIESELSEMNAMISQFRIENVGVDKRDLESIKTQLNVLGSDILSSEQGNEPEM